MAMPGKAMALAMKMKHKMSSGGEVCKSCGGKIGMAAGGEVPGESNEEENMEHVGEGGGVGEDFDKGMDDDLVYSPEVAKGTVDNTDDGDADDDDKRSGFLRAYMVSRKMKGG